MGQLIVFEGMDGCGKNTQMRLLESYLRDKTRRTIITASYPRYDQPESILVRNYLSGKYGGSPAEVDPKHATMFYAMDILTSYYEWKDVFEQQDDIIVLLDRYITSNLYYQGGKIHDDAHLWRFFDWFDRFVYRDLGLPAPDVVFWMDVDPNASQKLIAKRGRGTDIHEKNTQYIHEVSEFAKKYVCTQNKWITIKCMNSNNSVREPASILDDIISTLERKFVI